jgi:ATP-dependent protease HslVU (ClpYQ) peptidase subunit
MTCIVAVSDGRTVLLGGDSAAASDREVFIRATRKVFRAGAYAIGFTRSWRMGQILRHETELPEPPDTRDGEELESFLVTSFVSAIRRSFHEHGFAKTVRVTRTPDYIEEGQEIGGVFLIGVHGHIFEVHNDYHVARSATPYAAVGDGAIAALGALHALTAHTTLVPKELAAAALRAAETYSRSVRSPFHFIETGDAL